MTPGLSDYPRCLQSVSRVRMDNTHDSKVHPTLNRKAAWNASTP